MKLVKEKGIREGIEKRAKLEKAGKKQETRKERS